VISFFLCGFVIVFGVLLGVSPANVTNRMIAGLFLASVLTIVFGLALGWIDKGASPEALLTLSAFRYGVISVAMGYTGLIGVFVAIIRKLIKRN
jgi:hypothetical protein